MPSLRGFTLLAFLISYLSVQLLAQLPTGALRGTVTDASGAVVPAVDVRIRNATRGFERVVQTDNNGNYAAEGLLPGPYEIAIEKAGFSEVHRTAEVRVAQITRVDLQLTVGSAEETVTVRELPPLVDAESSTISGTISPESVESLPLNGRQFGDLATLVPGVLPAPNFDPIKTRIFNVSAGGSDGRSSNFSVDGGENTDIVNGGLLQNFTIEGIQEFQVASSRFSAAQGRALGAAVTVLTKSGTNDLHGSYFIFHRNQNLNAKDPFQEEEVDFNRTQQGFTLGGPLRRNRAFGFVAYENINEKNLGVVNTNGAYPTFEGSFEMPYDAHLLTSRADFDLTERQKLYARYAFENNSSVEGIGGTRSAENGVDSANRGSDLVIGHTFLISPRALNQFTYHFGHFRNALNPRSVAPEVVRPSLITGGAFNSPQRTKIVRNQLRDDFSISVGRGWGTHNLKFGADYNHMAVDAALEFASRGQFFFFTDTPLTETLADLAFLAVGDFEFPDYNDNIFGIYLQDDWKFSPRLSLNLGLRWDVSTNENNPDFSSPIVPAGSRSRDLNNLAPRIGFAFDLTGSGRAILRGGYGIFYALPVATAPAVESAFDGSRIGFGLFFGPIDVADPFPGLTQDQINALVFAQPQFLLLTLANNLDTPYVQQSSLGFQYQLSENLGFTADYVHSLGLRQRLGLDVNLDSAGNIGTPDTIIAQELGPTVAATFGPIIRVDDVGKSTYNALELSLNKRFSRGFHFMTSYTLSHAVDMGDDSIGSTVANPFDLEPERGDSNRDQRHRFVFSGAVDLPWKFELATITSFASARPYDIVTGESADGFAPGRPPGVTRNKGARDDAATIDAVNALRTAAGLPPITTTSPRSFFFYSTDLRLTKHFRIRDRLHIAAMIEAFNIFNHVNFLSNGGPTFSGVSGAQNNVFAPDFGLPRRTAGGVLGSGGPRAAQLGLRIEF